MSSSPCPSSTRSESLPRSVIIRRRTVFEAGRTQARRFSGKFFLLNILPRDVVKARVYDEISQVAFLTPKRLGPATVRNLLRRRMREVYRRTLAPQLQVQKGGSLSVRPYQIWVARPGATELDFAIVEKSMTELFTKWQKRL